MPSIPPAQLPQWFDRFPRETKFVLYDDDETISLAAYQTLRNAGFTFSPGGVLPGVLLGGLDEWVFQYGNSYVVTY